MINTGYKKSLDGRKRKPKKATSGKKKYVHGRISAKGNGTNEVWSTLLYHLRRNNTGNISMVHIIHTPEKEDTIDNKGKKKRKERKKRNMK